MDDAFVGIDVAFARNKQLPIVVCTWQGEVLRPLRLREITGVVPPPGGGNVAALDAAKVTTFVRDVVVYLRAIEATCGIKIRRVAIDAPSDPKKDGISRRCAEAGLDALGIRCITTPSLTEFDAKRHEARAHIARGGQASRMPHANQLWMLVGFELFRQLREIWECLEVFPQATVVRIGAGSVHKSKPDGLRAQLEAVARRTGWPQSPKPESLFRLGYGSLHDKLDAYLSAWVAALQESERVPIGKAPSDVIWVPQAMPNPARLKRTTLERRKQMSSIEQSVKAQFAKVFVQGDWRLFKRMAEFHL